ncbi:amidohydrolase family protein [Streptomyces sp. NPDC056002]|uniref:amidohydrolase family protein n=1 Tax=Streptomyces sp. NPDC056002 TaxID=3345675 RepID=UPI0035DFB2CB
MSSRKLITAARVVTGPGGRCVEDGAVLTEGDTVIAVGRRTEVEALADERDERVHWRMLPTVFGAERAERLFAQVRTMAERGVRLIAGTDAGVQRAGFDGLRQSLTFFEHIGMPAPRVLDLATTEAADALGVGGRTELLAPGRPANLIAASGDPSAGLDALTDLRMVMSRGELIPPQRAV